MSRISLLLISAAVQKLELCTYASVNLPVSPSPLLAYVVQISLPPKG